MLAQADLFASPRPLPSGFVYQPEILSIAEERELAADLEKLPFKEFDFHGFLGKRRVVSFGWRYDFNGGGLQKTEDLPAFLLPLRERVARLADGKAGSFQQALVTEYRTGAAIGWHRDRPMFDEVAGVSLLSPCVFRLRRKRGDKWERASLTAEPRSFYLMRGPSRSEWEHSIPAVEALRYSITFRNFKADRVSKASLD